MARVDPKIKLLKVTDARQPYPLSWDEQVRLFQQLPVHLARMALFKVNTGCRDQEVCGLRWEWEVAVPELETTVFLIPGHKVKNGDERLVVLESGSTGRDRKRARPASGVCRFCTGAVRSRR